MDRDHIISLTTQLIARCADRMDGQEDKKITAENWTKTLNMLDRRDGVDGSGVGDGWIDLRAIPVSIAYQQSDDGKMNADMGLFNIIKDEKIISGIDERTLRKTMLNMVGRGVYALKKQP